MQWRNLAFVLSALLALGSWAAEGKKPKKVKKDPVPQEMTAPKPGPEHERLKEEAGVWDATVKMYMVPGQPAMESKGTETNTLICGGFWLQCEFKSDMMGQPFEGRGLFGYDPVTKKHVGTWVDSMSATPAHSKGTYDASGKIKTSFMKMPDEQGKMSDYKEIHEKTDNDTRKMTMQKRGKDSKYQTVMVIEYKRRQ